MRTIRVTPKDRRSEVWIGIFTRVLKDKARRAGASEDSVKLSAQREADRLYAKLKSAQALAEDPEACSRLASRLVADKDPAGRMALDAAMAGLLEEQDKEDRMISIARASDDCPSWDTSEAVRIWFRRWKVLAAAGLASEMDGREYEFEAHALQGGICHSERCELLADWIDAYVEAYNGEGKQPMPEKYRVSTIDPLSTTPEEMVTIAAWIEWRMQTIRVK